jgi:diacylglycerol kinase (ATP)
MMEKIGKQETSGSNSRSPAKVIGARHLFAALGYSWSGARRLFEETAFRHEILLGLGSFALFAYAGATLSNYLVLLVLLLVLIAFEALNTAIEEIIDRISPEWSNTGRNAKNLGSFAVLCMLVAHVVYTAVTVMQLLAWREVVGYWAIGKG